MQEELVAVRIGTSGFMYEHWRRRFYPPGARGSELEFYAQTFDTVELNVTFYRMPSKATFRAWASRVPDDFVFAVKASRYLTHIKRLRDPRESVDALIERASELGSHLGPVLLQLPPDLALDLEGLIGVLDAFPRRVRLAVEPRHESWFVNDVQDVLEEHGAALCLADRRGPVTPLWHTAGWGYLRFHSGAATPRSCYGEAALRTWADRLRDTWGPNPSGYVYFNNDFNGCALRDAGTFARLLTARGVAVSRVPDIGDAVLDDSARVPARPSLDLIG
jgi:uncharacterized protein YecE (DUF72 family)